MQSVVTFAPFRQPRYFRTPKGGTMARAESKATAKVESGWLYHDGDEGAIQIGDSRWYRWLQLGKPSTIRSRTGAGSRDEAKNGI